MTLLARFIERKSQKLFNFETMEFDLIDNGVAVKTAEEGSRIILDKFPDADFIIRYSRNKKEGLKFTHRIEYFWRKTKIHTEIIRALCNEFKHPKFDGIEYFVVKEKSCNIVAHLERYYIRSLAPIGVKREDTIFIGKVGAGLKHKTDAMLLKLAGFTLVSRSELEKLLIGYV